MKYFFLLFFFAGAMVFFLGGTRGHKFRNTPIYIFPDMDFQAKVQPQKPSDFFEDGVASRKPIPGTIPLGFSVPVSLETPAIDAYTQGDDYYNTGKFGDYWGDGMPEEVGEIDAKFILHGKEKFDINCAICHGESGNGKGITSAYGVPNIANFHLPQFADPSHPDYRTDGSVYNTIAHGQGLMGPYGGNLNLHDRWAVVAYLRTLQQSWKMEKASVENFDAALEAQNAEPEEKTEE